MNINIIVATDNKLGIGKDNTIPWNIPADLKYFKEITTEGDRTNIVIMGRKTWESIPSSYRPLSNRINIVLSSQKLDLSAFKDTLCFDSLTSAIGWANNNYFDRKFGKIYIIGGAQVYEEAVNNFNINNVYQTKVYGDFGCDKFFMTKDNFKDGKFNDLNLKSVSKFQEHEGIHFRYFVYSNHYSINDPLNWSMRKDGEWQYLKILRKVLDEGIERDDRTGTGTIALFGERQEYDLTDTFPLLTTKRMFTRAIFEELMLYLRGQTDNKILVEKNIHIWDGNTTREFLDSRGLTEYPVGDMGETYGFNFRHFGGEYVNCETKYEEGNGFDQVKNVIHLIKNDPCSRRIIISLWNPKTNHRAALPSCLCWYQFFVDTKRNLLNVQIYLRSSDFFLANNWNVCTGSFLVHMLCNLPEINLTPGKIVCITGDTHVYKNHINAAETNLLRKPKPFPKLVVKTQRENIEDFQWEDFELVGYEPYPNIKAEMSV